MSNIKLFVSLIVVLFSLFLNLADGLKCFSCIHVEGFSDRDHINLEVGLLKGHSDATSDEEVEDTCGNIKYSGREITPGCMAFTFESKFGHADTSITVRGCLHTTDDTSKQADCSPRTLEQITHRAVGPMKHNLEKIAEFLDQPLVTKNGNFCACTSDLCNSATTLNVLFMGALFLPLLVVYLT